MALNPNIILRELQLPPIRTKRRHRKSRTGCFLCKERRVKVVLLWGNLCVNETEGCHARLAVCVYPENGKETLPSKPLARPNRAVPENISPVPSIESPPYMVSSSSELEVSETELAQCYLAHVSNSFGSGTDRPERDWVWHVHVPSLALCFPTIRDGMYTLAAMFMHFSERPCTSKFVDAANFYGTRFVETSRKQLARLEPGESDANLVCARLLFVLGLAFHREFRGTGFQYSNPIMWSWVHLLSGVKTVQQVILQSGQTIHPTILLDMTRHLHPNGDSRKDGTLEFHLLVAYIRETQHDRSAALHALALHSGVSLDNQQRLHCFHAVQMLDEITEKIQLVDREDVIRVLGACLASMHRGFLDMLEQLHHVALAIYAHWLLMLMLTEDLWVVDDMGRAGLDQVLSTVHEPEMERVLSFARQALTYPRIV
ncbi:transcription factor [Elasticomyces elasticus]|nr:transcription factor [Elasticomyces elasticus]